MQQNINYRVLASAIALASGLATSVSYAQQLEEIVVTAQKRGESLQDTPLAISAFNEKALDAFGIATLTDLVLTTPTLQAYDFPTSTSNISLFLRGFGNTDSQTLTIDNPVGLYIDGVYIARTTGATIDVIDLERVEILRGPQGTLYGRNSTAGAINFISKKPAEEFGGKVDLGAGRFGSWDVGASLDVPLMEGLRSKFSYQQSQMDGWVENEGQAFSTGQSAEDFYANEQTSYRVALAWDAMENVHVDYSYDSSDTDSNAPYYQQDTNDRQDTTTSVFVGGGAYRYVLPTSNTEVSGHNLTAAWNINDAMELKSITGYREMQEHSYQNWSDTLYFATDLDWNTDALSEEVQFLGRAFEERLKYIVGLYYFDESGDKEETQYTNGVSLSSDALLLPLADVSVLQGGNNLGAATISTDLESTAAFVQSTYTPDILNSKLDVTAGVRYTEDTRSADRSVVASNPSIQFPNGSNELDYNHTDWDLTFDYQITDFVSSYLRAATGFRAGGSAERALNFSQTFEEETAITYEWGLKSELLDQRLRLNAALYHTDYDDLLLTISGQPPQFASYVEVFNAGKATYDGFELDATAVLGERTTMSFSYAYLDTQLDDVIVPDNSFLLSGPPASSTDMRGEDITDQTYIPFAPENAFTIAIDHSIPFVYGSMDVHVDYAWRDELYSQPGMGLPINDLGLLNARIGVSQIKVDDATTMEIALWAKNLSDEEEVIYNLSNAGFQFNTPRTWGLDVRVLF